MTKITFLKALFELTMRGRVAQAVIEPSFQRINGGLGSANLENMLLTFSLEFEIECWGAVVSLGLLFAANPFSSAKWNPIKFQPHLEISNCAFGGLLEV